MRVLRTVLASLLLLATASTADAVKDMWPPFAKYDSGPLLNARYQTPIIRHLSPSKLIRACHGKHLACSYAEIGSPCEIFLPLVGWEKMVRHEMGHCRGWSADHKS
jgi:hypothetical protein